MEANTIGKNYVVGAAASGGQAAASETATTRSSALAAEPDSETAVGSPNADAAIAGARNGGATRGSRV